MFAVPYSRYVIGSLPWYSVLIVTGIVLAILHCLREEKRLGLKPDTVIDAALWVVPGGVIGARLYYVIFAWDTFADHPLDALKIWEGGLAIYGAVIGGVITVLLFCRARKLNPALMTDIIVPGLALAQAVGRWGNYFNMEAYGAAITDPAWQFFPAGVLIGDTWHMATFFYESMWNLIVYAALMALRRRTWRPGDLTGWYMLLYGAGRFVIEGLRTDSLMSGALRVSQWLSAGLCLAVLALFAWRAARRRRFSAVAAAAAALGAAAVLSLPETPLTARHVLLALGAVAGGAILYPKTKPEEC